MSTLSRRLPNLTATQRQGIKLTVVGLLLFLAYPVVQLAGSPRPTGSRIPFDFIAAYAAGVLVWGVFVLRTEKRRPMTPLRALWIPVLVIAMSVVADLFGRGRLIQLWEYIQRSWPRLQIDVIARDIPDLVKMAGSIYAVLGSAVRTRRWDAALPAIGLVLVATWFVALDPWQPRPILAVALFGIVPLLIGYRATAPPEE